MSAERGTASRCLQKPTERKGGGEPVREEVRRCYSTVRNGLMVSSIPVRCYAPTYQLCAILVLPAGIDLSAPAGEAEKKKKVVYGSKKKPGQKKAQEGMEAAPSAEGELPEQQQREAAPEPQQQEQQQEPAAAAAAAPAAAEAPTAAAEPEPEPEALVDDWEAVSGDAVGGAIGAQQLKRRQCKGTC